MAVDASKMASAIDTDQQVAQRARILESGRRVLIEGIDAFGTALDEQLSQFIALGDQVSVRRVAGVMFALIRAAEALESFSIRYDPTMPDGGTTEVGCHEHGEQADE